MRATPWNPRAETSATGAARGTVSRPWVSKLSRWKLGLLGCSQLSIPDTKAPRPESGALGSPEERGREPPGSDSEVPGPVAGQVTAVPGPGGEDPVPSAEQDAETPGPASEVLQPSAGQGAELPGHAHLGAVSLLGQAATTRSQRSAAGPGAVYESRSRDLFLRVRLGSSPAAFSTAPGDSP